ncbi:MULTISPECIES: hypothetical protein [unclassified Methylobacterium]|uniref:hypothetical protein n=1 Tax=unclassified Methylobacterium TaxID=2615210 RepID=UPI00164F63AC|nr:MULTISPECIES: hypothetical protein [unclassified Methylobacterium]
MILLAMMSVLLTRPRGQHRTARIDLPLFSSCHGVVQLASQQVEFRDCCRAVSAIDRVP